MKRRHWRCRKCDWSGYLSDDWLGSQGGNKGISLRLSRLACLATSTHSFAKASHHLRDFCGIEISAETLRKHCESEGRKMEGWLRTRSVVTEMFDEAEGMAEFQMDAGKVNTLEGWRDLKVASFARRPSAESATPEQWAKRTLPPPTAQVLIAAVESVEEFTPRLEKEAERLSLDREDVHCLGDGAEWIWKSVDQVFHQPRQTLDIYHGLEHLAQACKQTYGDGTELARTRYERAQALLLHQGAGGVETFLAEERALRPEAEPLLNDVGQYFAKHAQRLDYRRNLEEGLPIGSGMIEGNVKTLGLRLKARGARWQVDNVGAMAHLCCLTHSIYWDDFWASRARG